MAISCFTAAQKAELESIIQAAIAAAFSAASASSTPPAFKSSSPPAWIPPHPIGIAHATAKNVAAWFKNEDEEEEEVRPDIRVTLIKADKRVATGCKRYLRKHWELASLPPESGGFSCVSHGETAWCLSALLSAYWPPKGAFNGAGFEALGIG